MGYKILRYLTTLGILLSLSGPETIHAVSYEWNQTDWSGGVSADSAQHSINQNGWRYFLYGDPNVEYREDRTSGEIHISTIPGTVTDTNFNGGTSDNIDTTGGSLRLRNYLLDLGAGIDGNLTVDGVNPANSGDGLAHPRPVSTPANLALSQGPSGTLAATTYYYRVVAFNSKGESVPVKGSYALSAFGKSIIVSWDAASCAEGYRIYGRGRNGDDKTYGLLATVPSTQTSWEDSGILSPGISYSTTTTGGTLLSGNYYYKVTAYNENGEKTFALAEATLSNSNGTIKITWSPVSWATGYNIYGRPNSFGGTFGLLATTTALTWTDTGALTPDITRAPEENNVSDGSYRIDTLREYGNVSVVNCGSVSASSGTPLPSPTNLRTEIVSGINGPDGTFYYALTAMDSYGVETQRSNTVSISVSGTNAVRVLWGAVTGAAGYRVYRSTSGVFSTSSLVCSVTGTSCTDTVMTPSYGAPPVSISSIPAPSASVSSTGGALAQDTYYYVLTVVDTSGFETPPGPSRTRSVTYNEGTASVLLTWSAVSGAKGYRIYRTTTSGLFNSPSLICKIDNPSTLSCNDTLANPLDGAPPRSYAHALTNGKLEFRVNRTLYLDSSSIIHVNGKGYPGGNSVTLSSTGMPGQGTGAGGDRGAGAGYGTAGSNNSSGTGNTGDTYGSNTITMPYPGSGGASGSIENNPGISGRGGSGGGAVKIFAETMTLEGDISADGANGRDGYGSYYTDGGGGGSGGTILLGGRSVSLSRVSSIGGSGGAPARSPRYRYITGGSGGDGRIRIVSDNLVSGNISPLPYTGNHGTFESRSLELDSGGVVFSALSWTADVPVNSTLKFRIATSRDNITWNDFVGPNGTTDANDYFVAQGPGSLPIHPFHSGDRFLKYRVFMDSLTTNPLDSPVVYDISVEFLYTPRYQKLESSPYNSNDTTNTVTRVRWDENISSGSDLVLQLRTSSDGNNWGAWLGPRNTTFSASPGASSISVGSASGFEVGNRITITNSSNQMELKKITAISGNNITLDSVTAHSYAAGSVLTNTYTDPGGSEEVNSLHGDGTVDRWFQYRVFLISDRSTDIPYLLENIVSYGGRGAVYKPDVLIDTFGNNSYGAAGSGAGGSSSKSTNPAVQVEYDIVIQNEGNVASIEDFYEILWNTPSDISGTWKVALTDEVSGLTHYVSPVITEPITVGGPPGHYTLKVTPSPNAPPGNRNMIVDVHSGSDYDKVDSVRATIRVNTFYKADGIIDGGGTSTREGNPEETISYDLVLKNEGNVSDKYTLSVSEALPKDWKVYINDGSTDYDITYPSPGFTTQKDIPPPPPDAGATRSYTLKIIPVGSPATVPVIINIFSNSGSALLDSLTAIVVVKEFRRVDGMINGHGDGIYDTAGSGGGGFISKDVSANTTDIVTVGVQNEGNVADNYIISWDTPSGWSVVLTDPLLDGEKGVTLSCISPCEVPAIFLGAWPKYSGPDKYNQGEVPPFTFRITTPVNFTSGFEQIIFKIQSAGDSTKKDSVKAVINSGDTTPPDSVALSAGSVTDTSIRVSWNAPGDDGASGRAASYDLRYSSSPITEANFVQAFKVRSCNAGESNLMVPKSAGGAESCTITRLFAGKRYYFALKTSDEAGNSSPICPSSNPACSYWAETPSSYDAFKPGTITDLAVTYVAKDGLVSNKYTMTLKWRAPSDDFNNSASGPATAYDLRYSTKRIVDDTIVPGIGEIMFKDATPVTVLIRNGSGNLIPTCRDGITDNAQLYESYIATPGTEKLLPLPPGSPGSQECYTVIVENKIDLAREIKDAQVFDIIDDRTPNTKFYFAIKALDERGLDAAPPIADAHRSSISNTESALTPLVPNAYNVVSVPYVPPLTAAAPKDVFGDDVRGELYVYWWDSRGPNSDSGCYDGEPKPFSAIQSYIDGSNPLETYGDDKCSRLFSIKEGHGYFLWGPAGNTILDAPVGSITPLPALDCIDDLGKTFDCYVFPLQDGWNMIGSPFDKEINFTSIDINGNGSIDNAERGLYVKRINNEGGVKTFQDAVTANPHWIDGSIYTFNGLNRTYEVCDQNNCKVVLQPWKAYWIRLEPQGGATFELLVPY